MSRLIAILSTLILVHPIGAAPIDSVGGVINRIIWIEGVRYRYESNSTVRALTHRVRREVAAPTTVGGTLESTTNQIDYTGFTTAAPAAGRFSRNISIVVGETPGVPPVLPVCDVNGCTPGDPGIPSTPIFADFDFRTEFDPVVFGMTPASTLVNSYGVTQAVTDGVSAGAFIAPDVMTGTWSIMGPTETASGTFSVDVTGQFTMDEVISLQRNPASTGPVIGWTPAFVGSITDRREFDIANGVTVDGVVFDIAVVVPEPTAALALFPFGFLALQRRRRTA